MENSVVLITGALTGIGRATAFAFANEGKHIVISGRAASAGENLVAELRNSGAKAIFIQADIRYEADVQRLVDQTIDHFGRLDIAVNNAGIVGQLEPIIDQTIENYTEIFDTNVLGVFLCLKHELRVMQPQNKGSIINISSTLARRGCAGAALYAASKHALEGLTKSAALEAAAANIRVNAIAPGPVETEMLVRFTGAEEKRAELLASVPLKRAGQPEEIARSIVFLSSDDASFITGEVLGVNGGRSAQ